MDSIVCALFIQDGFIVLLNCANKKKKKEKKKKNKKFFSNEANLPSTNSKHEACFKISWHVLRNRGILINHNVWRVNKLSTGVSNLIDGHNLYMSFTCGYNIPFLKD